MVVVSFQAYKNIKQVKKEDIAYKFKILNMDKLALLEEMVEFQKRRAEVGCLTLSMMLQGIILFTELEKSSETRELKLLTRSYKRHLQYELDALKGIPPEAPLVS